MLTQVSVFAENAKGAMQKITSVLAENHIGIYSILTNDSGEFGTVRLLLSDPQAGLSALKDAGYQCNSGKVIAVTIEDTPGALDRLLRDIRTINVNIKYLYVTYDRHRSVPAIVFCTSSITEVEQSLQARGYETLQG